MTQNPFTAVFDAQRTAIEQSQSLTHDALEAQKTSISAFADAVETSSSLAESNAELTKGAPRLLRRPRRRCLRRPPTSANSANSSTTASTRPPRPSRSRSTPTSKRSRSPEVAYEEFAQSYSEVVDTSFDAYLEAHEQVEENVGAVAENVEEAADEFDVSA